MLGKRANWQREAGAGARGGGGGRRGQARTGKQSHLARPGPPQFQRVPPPSLEYRDCNRAPPMPVAASQSERHSTYRGARLMRKTREECTLGQNVHTYSAFMRSSSPAVSATEYSRAHASHSGGRSPPYCAQPQPIVSVAQSSPATEPQQPSFAAPPPAATAPTRLSSSARPAAATRACRHAVQ